MRWYLILQEAQDVLDNHIESLLEAKPWVILPEIRAKTKKRSFRDAS